MRRRWPNRWRWPSGRCAGAGCAQASGSRWWGQGAVGLMAVQAAAAFGADGVAVVEPLPERRALAIRLGAGRAGATRRGRAAGG